MTVNECVDTMFSHMTDPMSESHIDMKSGMYVCVIVYIYTITINVSINDIILAFDIYISF